MTVLVVGGSGFIGSAITRALSRRGLDAVALSRSIADGGLAGDVTLPDLGLDGPTSSDLRQSVTHVVSCFGSVDWGAGPRQALDLHLAGTRKLLDFAANCGRLERLVHVSSVLALGRARGTVGNRELSVGQRFRNWYEYGKFLAECTVRNEARLPARSVRLGPILGLLDGAPPDPRYGLAATLPSLLRGYPAPLATGGRYPCYVTDVSAAAEVVVEAALRPDGGPTWTWFDPALPTLAQVLIELCAAWNVMPRIVELRPLNELIRIAARRLAVPVGLLDYTQPWVEIDPAVIGELPIDPPAVAPDYVRATGEAIMATHLGALT